MALLLWLVVGGIAGWLASIIMGTDKRQGLLMDIIVGVLGAVAGGFLMSFFGEAGVTGFNIYSLLVAVLGSVVLLGIYKTLSRTV